MYYVSRELYSIEQKVVLQGFTVYGYLAILSGCLRVDTQRGALDIAGKRISTTWRRHNWLFRLVGNTKDW